MRMNDPGRIVDIDQVTPIRAIFTLFLEDKILNNRKFIQKFCLLVQVCSFYGFLKHLHAMILSVKKSTLSDVT